MARRVPRRTPDTAAAEHLRESFGGAARGRSSVPLPVSLDSKLLARLNAGAGSSIPGVLAYQDTFTLTGVADETVELTYLPLTYSEHAYLNGVYQQEGADYDWTRDSGTRTITVKAAMDARAGDILIVEYLYYAGVPAPVTGSSTATEVAAGSWDYAVSSITPGLPAGVQTGDLLILQVAHRTDTALGGLSGWTLVASDIGLEGQIIGPRTVGVSVYRRVYDSGSYSGPTISGNGMLGRITGWRNATVGAVSTWNSGTQTTGGYTADGLTTTSNGAIVLLCGGIGDDNNVSSLACSGLSDLSTEFSESRQPALQMNGWGTFDTAASAGATGDITFTTSNGYGACLVCVELRD